MDYYLFMGKISLVLFILMQFFYVVELFLKKVVPPLKVAWPVVCRFKDQVLVPTWVKILKKWRAKK